MSRPPITPEQRAEMKREKAARRARELFNSARKAEKFFATPGVDVAIRAQIYSGAKTYSLLPNWKLEVKVQRWEDVQEMEEVLRHALKRWAAGGWDRSLCRLRCPICDDG